MRVVEAIFVQRGYNLATMPSKNKDIFQIKKDYGKIERVGRLRIHSRHERL